MTMTPAVGIIGVGEIASAIVDGLCSAPDTAPEIFLSPRSVAVTRALAQRYPTVYACADNQEVVERAAVLILSVRPQVLWEVLADLEVPADRVVISAVAGADHEHLHRALGDKVTVVRAIPLPAVRQRRGVTVIHPAHPVVEGLFAELGDVLAVDDADTLTAIQATTATISTHLHYLTAISTWLAEHGVSGADADTYVRRMFSGVAEGFSDADRTLAELATAHETPDGINEQLRRQWFTPATSTSLTQALEGVRDRLTR